MSSEETFSFGREKRLINAEEFQNVFSNPERFGNNAFTVLARKNGLSYPRLGLAISKKCAKNAVDRNRIKRLFRESFRLNQKNLPSVDIVAMCKPKAITLDNKQALKQIDTQWYFLRKKFANNSSQ